MYTLDAIWTDSAKIRRNQSAVYIQAEPNYFSFIYSLQRFIWHLFKMDCSEAFTNPNEAE